MTTDNARFGLLGAVGMDAAERAARTIDTGCVDPGSFVLLTLPPGLPTPYYFNLFELEEDPGGAWATWIPQTQHPRIIIRYANEECWTD